MFPMALAMGFSLLAATIQKYFGKVEPLRPARRDACRALFKLLPRWPTRTLLALLPLRESQDYLLFLRTGGWFTLGEPSGLRHGLYGRPNAISERIGYARIVIHGVRVFGYRLFPLLNVKDWMPTKSNSARFDVG
jgi:hypothetical protein